MCISLFAGFVVFFFQLSINQLREVEEAQHPVEVRKRALAVERERAKHIAVNKPHPTQPLIKVHAILIMSCISTTTTVFNISHLIPLLLHHIIGFQIPLLPSRSYYTYYRNPTYTHVHVVHMHV